MIRKWKRANQRARRGRSSHWPRSSFARMVGRWEAIKSMYPTIGKHRDM